MNKLFLLGGAALVAYLLFGKKQSGQQNNDPLIQQFIDKIKADPVWLASVQAKATENGLTLDDQLQVEAVWMIQQGWTI